MSVHYKFKSALDYDTVTFDGLHISVGDLKTAITQQKRIGKTSDFDLQITNAQTKEVYVDDSALIPKNTSLLVARVPLSQQPKKHWDGGKNNGQAVNKDAAQAKGLADLSRMEGSELDKINAMIQQSTQDYDPSNYQKIRGQNQRGEVPPNYRCFKCQKGGHWIKDCPLANLTGAEAVEIRRSTGIPRSFMVPVDGPKAPGAMMTPSGSFAVPVVDHEAYMASENNTGGEPVNNAPAAGEPAVPDDLICSLCRDLLTDAVMIPCCGNSFCDECIRSALLESEDRECPDCREKEISPTTLIPNRFLRNSVSSFRNQTGYSRRTPHRQPTMQIKRPGPDQNGPQNPMLPHLHQMQPVGPNGPMTGIPGSMGGPPGPMTGPPGGPPGLKPPGMETPPNMPPMGRLADEQRSSTPTVDERRDPVPAQRMYNRGPPFNMPPGQGPHPGFIDGFPRDGPPPRFPDRFPREPYQPPPPGIKESPTFRRDEDPLEAFNRMIREKEERAKRREERRHRPHSRSHTRTPPALSRSRSPPPRPRVSPPRSRSPPPQRSRSPPPPLRARTPPSRASSRIRYSRSRSPSRGRGRRSPWSLRRRRSRERTLSLTRSPSPRRHRSPLRYRSPLRSPPGRRSPPRSPRRSPPRSPSRPILRTPPPRGHSPLRFGGVYEDISPPRRSVEPPFGARYAGRHGPPPGYQPGGPVPIPSLGDLPPRNEPSPYRGRYGDPPFEDIPPGAEPPVPGYEPPPFEKPMLGPPVDRMPAGNFRDGPFQRGPYPDGPLPYRDNMPSVPPKDMPPHVVDRYRDNFRGGPPMQQPFRDPGVPFRDGQPPFRDPGIPPHQYRDPNFRGPPHAGFRDNPPYRNNSAQYREVGPPGNYRDNPPHGFRDGHQGRGPNFRDGPNTEPREVPPATTYEHNTREGFREIPPLLPEAIAREFERSKGFRPNSRNRVPPRRYDDRRRDERPDRDYRDRERYDHKEGERSRDPEKMDGRDKPRIREFERSRDHVEKERDRDREERGRHERYTPEKKRKSASPKRSRDNRDRKRTVSRGRSKDKDSKKKEEKTRDRSSDEKNKDAKDKERKLRDKKKKKKEKEIEKKKKREKKDKKEKDKKEDDETEIKEGDENKEPSHIVLKQELKDNVLSDGNNPLVENGNAETNDDNKNVVNDLYGDDLEQEIDKKIIENYVKKENELDQNVSQEELANKNENDVPFDGIELQANAEELDLKGETEIKEKEVLAPMPALSKWEVDEDNDKNREPGEISSPEIDSGGKVTSEVIKRAENAIFAKAISSIRPIEIKKISSDRIKLYSEDGPERLSNKEVAVNNIQITVPSVDDKRSIEINDRKKGRSKTPPPKLSIKERLGGKIEQPRRNRDERIIQSTVERIKSRSKTPKRDHPYRRVTVDREHSRRQPGRLEEQNSGRIEAKKHILNERRSNSRDRIKKKEDKIKRSKEERRVKKLENSSADKEKAESRKVQENTVPDRERKKSTLDEAHFEPDYDETVESDEGKDDTKKRNRSKSPLADETQVKKAKTIETETIKLDLANVKKKPESDSESSSGSDTSSSSTTEEKKRKRKKKKTKRKKKRIASDSDSESESDSDDHKKKKKKRKHKKKSSKKKKKSSKNK